MACGQPGCDGATQAVTQSAGAEEARRRDLAFDRVRAKDGIWGRWSGQRSLKVAAGQVPFGSEPDGKPLSDHFGYVVNYSRSHEVDLVQTDRTGASS